MYQEIRPRRAHELLGGNEDAIYLDVRSQVEFAAGHVPGAFNIPIVEPDATGAMVPNRDFARVLEASVPKSSKVIVGCKSGGRSTMAAQTMVRMGYTDVSNMLGGFHGAVDWMGNLVEPGWTDDGLPMATTPAPDRSYAALAAKARK